MIPTVELKGSSAVPTGAIFWMPARSEIEEEGIGGCRDTWTILDVPVSEARAVMRIEQDIVEALDAVTADAESYERLAELVENVRELGEELSDLRDDEQQFVERYSVVDDGTHLGGLEVGVAGMVNALAAVRIIPAASTQRCLSAACRRALRCACTGSCHGR